MTKILKIIGSVCLGLFLLFPPRALFFLGLGLLITAAFKISKNQNLKPLFVPTGFFITCNIVKFAFNIGTLFDILILIAFIIVILKKIKKPFVAYFLIFLWIFLGAWDYGFWWPTKEFDKEGPVVFFGDSLTAGLEGDEEILFTTQLQKEFTTPIINSGKAGNMTRDALNRLEKDVLSHDPSVVIIMIGGNDFLSKRPRKEVEENLENIVSQIHEKGINILLVEVPGGAILDKYLGVHQQAAKRYGLHTIKEHTLRKIFFLSSHYTSDGIHLNENGHTFLAKKFEKYLEVKYCCE